MRLFWRPGLLRQRDARAGGFAVDTNVGCTGREGKLGRACSDCSMEYEGVSRGEVR
jgi:hypothetical protein